MQLQDWLLRRVSATGVRRVLSTSAALASDVGVVRTENQDRLAVGHGQDHLGEPYIVVALADGIGGMKDGGRCAALTVSAVFDIVHQLARSGSEPSVWTALAVEGAHKAVRAAYGSTGGATLVVLLVTKNEGVFWASIGDSRLYLWSQNEMTQVSTDDTIAGQLGRSAKADAEQQKLLQYVGMDGPLEFEVAKLRCSPEDTAILTTDGVHFLGQEVMSLVIRHAPDGGATARRLTDLARWAGGHDNATIAVISLDLSRYDAPPETSNLDVWDSFGELRLSFIASALHKSVQAIDKTTSAQTAESPKPLDQPSEPPDIPNEENAPSKKKGTKGKGPKRKPRTPRNGTIPQVQLEFSNGKT